MHATTNDRILIATRKGLFEARKGAGGWSLQAPKLTGKTLAYAVRDPRNGAVWASIDHGHWGVKLARSNDDGATFAEVEAPKYPEDSGKTAKYYWVLEPGPASNPDEFWIGTEPGGLFQSNDDGASWSLNEPLWKMCVDDNWQGGGRDLAGIHSICRHPTDAQRAYVAISCAGVVGTTDGGASWSYVNKGMTKVFDPGDDTDFGHDPHCVAMSPSSPDVLWQSNHCGVFRSTNGAQSWDELSDKPWIYFGFPVAAHPTNPDVAWLVPMESDQTRTTIDDKLVVMRTDDAGKSWNPQTSGLPAPSFDFPYRHGLDVSADGETLVMGTTSGNLYVSEDGGRAWQTLSSNLPLIYATRFA